MTSASGYWDALAPHHSALENNYFDLPSLRRIVHDVHQPVLVVGAGHGLIVAELRKSGLRSDGIDLSSGMIRYAKTRRGLSLVQADARALPFGEGTYETIWACSETTACPLERASPCTGSIRFRRSAREVSAHRRRRGRIRSRRADFDS